MARRNEINLDITPAAGTPSYFMPAVTGGTLQATKITSIGDAPYVILPTDRIVALTAALTALRQITLPAANSLRAGERITVIDLVGGVSFANSLNVIRAGSDTINGVAANTLFLFNPFVGITLVSDGVSRWTTYSYTQFGTKDLWTEQSSGNAAPGGLGKHVPSGKRGRLCEQYG